MKALIEIDVPEWQIGKTVDIYFPDTMHKRGVIMGYEDKKSEIIGETFTRVDIVPADELKYIY